MIKSRSSRSKLPEGEHAQNKCPEWGQSDFLLFFSSWNCKLVGLLYKKGLCEGGGKRWGKQMQMSGCISGFP